MASNVTRDHHNLRRNLKLNDNYISNDGGNEGISIDDAGDVGINTPTTITPSTKLEVFNSNVQHSAGTASQSLSQITGSGTTFTAEMVGGRFIFDDGTDGGIVTYVLTAEYLILSTTQSVSSGNYKIYYPSVQIDTGASSTSLKIGNTSFDTSSGDISLASGLGGNIMMTDGTSNIFNFDVTEPSLTIYDDADTDGDRDYLKMAVGANGATTITTNDDDGTDANLSFVSDGTISFTTATSAANGLITLGGAGTIINPHTKTVSGTGDSSLSIAETLNLGSGEAGGSDVHYGIRYTQSQIDLGGWNSVYLMYIYGGDAARTFVVQADGKVGIGEAAPQDTLEVNGTVLVKDALKFTQDDGNEFIDSLNDEYLDIGATTGIRLKAPTLCEDKLYFTQTDGNEYIDSLNDEYLDLSATTAIRLKQDTLIESTKKLYFNDVGGEWISGSGDDLTITSGVNVNIDAAGHVEFDGCGVGFDLETPTYDATDTDVNFINGNKQFVTFGSGNITDLNLIFPKISGNFLLMLKQDGTGSRTVTNYKVWDRNDSTAAAGSATVKFAGGSSPTLTTDANHVDIISFFYDGDNEIAYGVPSLDFQF